MRCFFIVMWAAGAYFAIALAIYALLTKVDPYDPASDDWGDGDFNKGVTAFWPIMLPLYLFFAIGCGISKAFDKLREDIIDKRNQEFIKRILGKNKS